MSIPDYQTLMLPLLRQLVDQQQHSLPSVIYAIAAEFQLSGAEKQQLLPSGKQLVLNNRVGWARTYLKKAGLLQNPKRGFLQITTRGMHGVLASIVPKGVLASITIDAKARLTLEDCPR